jgi:hypothetical protein
VYKLTLTPKGANKVKAAEAAPKPDTGEKPVKAKAAKAKAPKKAKAKAEPVTDAPATAPAEPVVEPVTAEQPTT